ncbi:hypothetical protein BKA67DRAFT_536684 [Truncatella angustata]|uniref:Uncharacterized protein n=1 Tax=Truncatella angustata TaxID=152316 RepID=A0A9P8ZVV5_9PEZI|nr:uncharacterized protein BKA67DRAFT_536684 [Truncatella angustata]KAH6652980.1 hypothetical protein BKA67DRAFT_536684 [Truncatella angustata]KAH8198321.1 hypothetical protein TruAng_007523 [Truncatella angustata]
MRASPTWKSDNLIFPLTLKSLAHFQSLGNPAHQSKICFSTYIPVLSSSCLAPQPVWAKPLDVRGYGSTPSPTYTSRGTGVSPYPTNFTSGGHGSGDSIPTPTPPHICISSFFPTYYTGSAGSESGGGSSAPMATSTAVLPTVNGGAAGNYVACTLGALYCAVGKTAACCVIPVVLYSFFISEERAYIASWRAKMFSASAFKVFRSMIPSASRRVIYSTA